MTTTTQPGLGQITGNVLFYSQPEPLTPELHGKLGVKRMDGPFSFARVGHAIPLTVGEFPLAAVTGPIIFVGDEKLPIAVMGLNAGENMFVRDNGMFEPGVYIPGLGVALLFAWLFQSTGNRYRRLKLGHRWLWFLPSRS